MAIIVALALILVITIIVAATQVRVGSELSSSRAELDYERALLAAEAGANAYLHQLANGGAPASVDDLSVRDFRAAVTGSKIELVPYNAGSEQAYFAGTAPDGSVLGYGWSRGVIRKVVLSVQPLDLFGWAGAYGLDPTVAGDGTPNDGAGPGACVFATGVLVTGRAGAQGLVRYSGVNSFLGGPLVLGGPNARFNPAVDPVVLPSGSGTLADPTIRRYSAPLAVPTASTAANQWAAALRGVHTTAGVDYFRTDNNNTTGFRFLVKNILTGHIRELPGSYSVLNANQYVLDDDHGFDPSSGQLISLGMVPLLETFYGLRVYPGDYYFQTINMSTAARLRVRGFSDSERAAQGQASEPANPNPGASARKTVRFWIGNPSGGSTGPLILTNGIEMGGSGSPPLPASRFQIYARGGVSIRIRTNGSGSPPAPLRADLLCCGVSGSSFGGEVRCESGAYFIGSLVGWRLAFDSGSTLQQELPDAADAIYPISYRVTAWKEESP